MAPFITDIPVHETNFRRAATIETVINNPISRYSTELFEKTYYLITERDFKLPIPESITINGLFPAKAISSSTVSIVNISTVLFSNSKPLEGKELEVLNKTYRRLLSKTPTKL